MPGKKTVCLSEYVSKTFFSFTKLQGTKVVGKLMNKILIYIFSTKLHQVILVTVLKDKR